MGYIEGRYNCGRLIEEGRCSVGPFVVPLKFDMHDQPAKQRFKKEK